MAAGVPRRRNPGNGQAERYRAVFLRSVAP